jgi:PPE-repeat protein
MAQSVGNAKNILVGASPLFLSSIDVNDADYIGNAEAGVAIASGSGTVGVPAFATGVSYTTTLNNVNQTAGLFGYRNVGFTNNGLQITYNPTYDSVTVDQLLDTAKLFKSAMEVMIATEMSEGTLENIATVFGQAASTLADNGLTGAANVKTLGLEAGALGAAPTERQLIAVGQAPTASSTSSERVYYARRVLSVQQSQFSLARTTPTTFPVTFRLLPDAAYAGSEYGKIIDRVLVATA